MSAKPRALPPGERIRCIDILPGDLIATPSHPEGVPVVESYLAIPGSRYSSGSKDRTRRHEWWVKIVWTDHQGRVNSQTQRFQPRAFDEKCVVRVLPSPENARLESEA